MGGTAKKPPGAWWVDCAQHEGELRVTITNRSRLAVRLVHASIAMDDSSLVHLHAPRLAPGGALTLVVQAPAVEYVPTRLAVRWRGRFGRARRWSTDL